MPETARPPQSPRLPCDHGTRRRLVAAASGRPSPPMAKRTGAFSELLLESGFGRMGGKLFGYVT